MNDSIIYKSRSLIKFRLNHDVLMKVYHHDVSHDTYPMQKELQCRLPIQKRLKLLLQLFPLESPPDFSGQTKILTIKDTKIIDHKSSFIFSENSAKNLLAIAEANRIKYVFIKLLANNVRLPLLKIGFFASINNILSSMFIFVNLLHYLFEEF